MKKKPEKRKLPNFPQQHATCGTAELTWIVVPEKYEDLRKGRPKTKNLRAPIRERYQ